MNRNEDAPTRQDEIDAARHKAFQTHRLHECHDENCSPCSGGLSLCAVCGGAEAAMPYECPGEKITEQQGDDIMGRRRDFIAGEWRELPQKEKQSP